MAWCAWCLLSRPRALFTRNAHFRERCCVQQRVFVFRRSVSRIRGKLQNSSRNCDSSDMLRCTRTRSFGGNLVGTDFTALAATSLPACCAS